ncbi:hypothetical protein HK103_006351 [Boothiomyces macroporosus]|uniref:TsaA-like domain-containing protein n=1 Tax=Boothiomyces macroporosus TaxID=261099 RepID=A0AAD5UDX2_9FUNG|nr:hypothetical protein HK103_006351 [Boothiomyces macroporosus]
MELKDISIGVVFGIGIATLYFTFTRKQELEIELLPGHEHCKQKIQAERVGRINAEKSLRKGVVEKICNSGYPLLTIGYIDSPYVARRGTPRQGLLVPSSRSIIKLSPELPQETLEGLATYSHLHILFLFHENTNLVKTLIANETNSDASLKSRSFSSKSKTFTNRVQSFAAKVLPPLLNGGSIGLFATRSPHRPNAIGSSLVQIVRVNVEEKTVTVAGADLVHGTPIVDLKPWGPFDCPSCIHQMVDHDLKNNYTCPKNGSRCSKFAMRIPQWVAAGLQDPYQLPVEWNDDSIHFIRNLVDSEEKHSNFYENGESQILIDAISEMLSLDIRSVHRGRGQGPMTELVGQRTNEQKTKVQDYEVDYDMLNIKFTVRFGNHHIHQDTAWVQIEKVTQINYKQ